ncbi:hypothetical protein D9M69_345060 [compost metagenome]
MISRSLASPNSRMHRTTLAESLSTGSIAGVSFPKWTLFFINERSARSSEARAYKYGVYISNPWCAGDAIFIGLGPLVLFGAAALIEALNSPGLLSA